MGAPHSIGGHVSDLTYDNPLYYEIAFSYRNIPEEVDLFEENFRRFAKIDIHSVLEIACGNSPHMEELLKRGFRYAGIDLNDAMLEYSRAKAKPPGHEIELHKADMNDFAIPEPVDFAYIMLGSLSSPTTEALHRHFDCVAGAVKPGGLYLLDWCINTDPATGASSWEMERDGIRVMTTVEWTAVNTVKQLVRETITLAVNDHGTEKLLTDSHVRRVIYPQEFRLLVSAHPHWEFMGWWNCWNMDQPLETTEGRISRPIVTLRRK